MASCVFCGSDIDSDIITRCRKAIQLWLHTSEPSYRDKLNSVPIDFRKSVNEFLCGLLTDTEVKRWCVRSMSQHFMYKPTEVMINPHFTIRFMDVKYHYEQIRLTQLIQHCRQMNRHATVNVLYSIHLRCLVLVET